MNISHLFFVVGLVCIALSLRTIRHPLAVRGSFFFVVAASFAAAFFTTDSILVASICASSWFMLPAVEMLIRIRNIRLPSEKKFRARFASQSDDITSLTPWSSDFGRLGFEALEEASFECEQYRQDARYFYRKSDSIFAALYVVSNDMSQFGFVTLFTQSEGGKVCATWNYPFPSGLIQPPHLISKRVKHESTLAQIIESHAGLVAETVVSPDRVRAIESETMDMLEFEARESRAQIQHNISLGLLYDREDGTIQYTWRGCFYLWRQALAELVRLM